MGTFIRFPPRGGGSIQPVDGCFLRELPHRFLAFQVSGGTRQKKFLKAQLDFILYTGYRMVGQTYYWGFTAHLPLL